MRICLLLIVLSLIISCKSNTNEISLLTDDPFIYDAVLLYNGSKSATRIKAVLIKSNETLFSASSQKNIDSYDIIAGSFFPNNDFSFDRFSRIKITTEDSLYFKFIYDFYEYTNQKSIIYKAEAPVIITNKSNTKVNQTMTFDEFKTECDKETTLYRNNGINNKFAFIPQLSTLSELDFYTMNSDIFIKNEKEKEIFNSNVLNQNFNYYTNFNDSEIDPLIIHKAINKYSRDPSKYFLERNLLTYDLTYLSTSMLSNKYRLIFLKNHNTASLKQSVITINNKSKYKNYSENFIDFVLSEETQNKLFLESVKRKSVYNTIFIPVITKNNQIMSNSFKNGTEIFNYIQNLKYCNFGNNKNRKKFFKIFNTASDMIDKERLKKKDFINFIEKNLN
ncbi:MAG: hypothetical protein A2015_08700 [Spirochaetes bacterium GWF1_31_7]|nr:MAG: hypothetical protein A2Y30_06960 [Spirochaetes bacterium GWE1_32_154]OHD48000.1 MAG: hypothetical protein A2015_08700 [Spirochaetes bacterium GWF1_31_7]OHD48091.1 MAG: hypothetical protein A2Y29_08035 [Spirochaetes bacterium GWE2_31_10]HBD92789.1 hypothetical protein [Spirochaetia bacterium]HBI36425.1 hypothetical protein [Spirochaetia bacterium]